MSHSTGTGRRRGLTLIELVVVLLILAVLAGLVIPQVAMLSRTADMTGSADSQRELAGQIQLHFALLKRFPQRMDSLLVGGTAVYVPVVDGSGNQTSGLPASSITFPNGSGTLHGCLTPKTFANATGAEYLRSITRCGFDFVMDHDAAVVNSNNSGTIERALSGTVTLAEVTAGSGLARALFPGTNGVPPFNGRLFALGIGPRSSLIPNTMLQAPVYPGCDGSYYGRYIAVFNALPGGERANLVGVVDAYGRWPDYTQQQINESLPNGARQG